MFLGGVEIDNRYEMGKAMFHFSRFDPSRPVEQSGVEKEVFNVLSFIMLSCHTSSLSILKHQTIKY